MSATGEVHTMPCDAADLSIPLPLTALVSMSLEDHQDAEEVRQTATTFKYFPDLSKELRCMIWAEAAKLPLVFTLRPGKRDEALHTTGSRCHLYNVNKEAREEWKLTQSHFKSMKKVAIGLDSWKKKLTLDPMAPASFEFQGAYRLDLKTLLDKNNSTFNELFIVLNKSRDDKPLKFIEPTRPPKEFHGQGSWLHSSLIWGYKANALEANLLRQKAFLETAITQAMAALGYTRRGALAMYKMKDPALYHIPKIRFVEAVPVDEVF
ncbi:hypothetical protein B0J14DRAFT_640347 [Halenospora varia]|nr:hypothetical protein B0J14DRAFT_640347 [Halenospora varia]